MFTQPVWHVCSYDESVHLVGPWCERASTSTAAAVPGVALVQPRPALVASSHRTPSTRSLPVFTPLGVSERFRC